MSDGTHIEWTDATVNAVNGCSVLSPGCTNCYAMRLAGTRLKHHPSRAGLTIDTKAGPVWTGEVRFNEAAMLQPLRWKRPRKIFWNAHGDLFHENVPDEWIDRCFAVMALTPQHVHQVLTKRPERMRDWFARHDAAHDHNCADMVADAIAAQLGRHGARGAERGGPDAWPLSNVWLGVSVEDQKRADERIPVLLDTPAAVRWLSCEPLLGPLDLEEWLICPKARDGMGPVDPETGISECCSDCDFTGLLLALDWVVVGGESGPGASPMHPDWARSLRDQCEAASVPFLFKQWGNWAPLPVDASDPVWGQPLPTKLVPDKRNLEIPIYRVGKKRAGRSLDGVQHEGYPA